MLLSEIYHNVGNPHVDCFLNQTDRTKKGRRELDFHKLRHLDQFREVFAAGSQTFGIRQKLSRTWDKYRKPDLPDAGFTGVFLASHLGNCRAGLFNYSQPQVAVFFKKL